VVEGVPAALGARLTEVATVPTIGIGAGPDCDGQVLVLHDLLGLGEGPTPKFVRAFEDLGALAERAVARFAAEVVSGGFPSAEESYR
jgi:3-methyl-2-oxobutanoate hydroxymethyltransferase